MGCTTALVSALVVGVIDILRGTEVQLIVHLSALAATVALTILVVVQTRVISEQCATVEIWLPALFIFLPPNALGCWASRQVSDSEFDSSQ